MMTLYLIIDIDMLYYCHDIDIFMITIITKGSRNRQAHEAYFVTQNTAMIVL